MLIPHQRPLLQGCFIARYDRFIARIALPQGEVDAHCVNPGRMEGLIVPGARAWVSTVPEDSKRKLRYTLELLQIEGCYVGANTVIPNHLAEVLVRAGQIPGLKRFSQLRREVRYGANSRIDLLLRQGAVEHYVEVKNCHLVYPDGGAYFPDSVSTRAAGHLEELALVAAAGAKASVLFVVQHPKAAFVTPSRLHDPAFAHAAAEAARAGVRFRAVKIHSTPAGYEFLGSLPVRQRGASLKRLQGYREQRLPQSGWQRRGKPKAS